jgi:hypothetical protein
MLLTLKKIVQALFEPVPESEAGPPVAPVRFEQLEPSAADAVDAS